MSESGRLVKTNTSSIQESEIHNLGIPKLSDRVIQLSRIYFRCMFIII